MPDKEGSPSYEQWKSMVQKLLTDRFKLTFHHDKKELSVYAYLYGCEERTKKRHQAVRALRAGLLHTHNCDRRLERIAYLRETGR